jgi:hypothetical protein
MTEISRPWNGTTIGDAGPYSDADWHQLYRAIIGYGAGRANNGVFLMSGAEPENGLKVQAQNPVTASIDVLAGAALVQGIAYINDATVSFTIAANASGNPRIDTVVVQADYALQTIRLVLKQGTPAASPVAPALTQSANIMWEIPLADIAVANGFSTIAQTAISPRQDWVNAPPAVYLDHVLNNSGATLNHGQVVIADTTADRAATTIATRDSKRVLGVWQGQTANGAYGRVLRLGIGYVHTDAAVTRGDLLTTSTTAGSATTPGTLQAAANAVLGRALETTSGAGLVLAYINPHTVNMADYVLVQDQKPSGTTYGNVTLGAWRTRDLNTEVVDTGGIAAVAANQVTLQRGRYSVVGFTSSGANILAHRCRLRDVTNGVTLVQGVNALNQGNTSLSGEFELTGVAALEMQHWVSGTGSGGLPVTTGEPEVYTSLYFIRHGETS